jgi:hypothetical protein
MPMLNSDFVILVSETQAVKHLQYFDEEASHHSERKFTNAFVILLARIQESLVD